MTDDPIAAIRAANPVPDPDAAVDTWTQESTRAFVLGAPQRSRCVRPAPAVLAVAAALTVAIVAVLAAAPSHRGTTAGVPAPVAAFAAEMRPGAVLHMAFQESTPPGERKRVLTETWERLDSRRLPAWATTSRTRFHFADGSYDDRVSEFRSGGRYRNLRYTSSNNVLRIGPWRQGRRVPPATNRADVVYGPDDIAALGIWLRRGVARADHRVVTIDGRRAYRVFTRLPSPMVWFLSANAKRPTLIAVGDACPGKLACHLWHLKTFEVISNLSTTAMPRHPGAHVRRGPAEFPDEGS